MTDSPLIPLTEAVKRYGIPLGKLAGRILRKDLADPRGGELNGEWYVYDDLNLQRLAKQCAGNSMAVQS